jgi:hypothetical protein
MVGIHYMTTAERGDVTALLPLPCSVDISTKPTGLRYLTEEVHGAADDTQDERAF